MSNLKLKVLNCSLLLLALLIAFTSCTVGLPGNPVGADNGQIYDTTSWTALPAEIVDSSWAGTLTYINQAQVTTKIVDSWHFRADSSSTLKILGAKTGEADIYEGRCSLDAKGNLKYVLKLKTRNGSQMPADSETLWGEAQLNLTNGTGTDSDAKLFTRTGVDTLKQVLQLSLMRKTSGGSTGQTEFNFSTALTTDGTGSGSIDSALSTANGTYKRGTAITVEATAAQGSLFVGWYDAPLGGKLISTQASYSFSLTEDTKLYAAFSLNVTYSFSTALATGGTGTGTINSAVTTANGSYNDGTYITVEAVPGADSKFGGWYNATTGGELVSAEVKYSFKLSKDTALYASFTLLPKVTFSRALATEGDGSGSIKSSSTANGSYTEGTEITVEAIANSGSSFSGWYDAAVSGKLVSSQAKYSFKLTAGTALYAKFELLSFNFSTGVSTSGQGTGSIDSSLTTADGSYKGGTAVTAKAVAASGSIFTGWYDAAAGGILLSSAVNYSFKLTKDRAIYARFELDQYVTFEDIALDTAVRKALNKTTGHLTKADVATLTVLKYVPSSSMEISSLKGIEHLTSLKELNLNSNNITDISCLQGLTNLTKLSLTYNKITDISPLKNMTKLVHLDLENNYRIVDITPLQFLTELNYLDLGDNKIVDITTLQLLTKLDRLYLTRNKGINDITPLLRNIGIGSGDSVSLYEIPAIPYEQVSTLKYKGVTVTR